LKGYRLLWYNNEQSGTENGSLDLTLCTCSDVIDDNYFIIGSGYMDKQYKISCPNGVHEARAWIKAITNAITILLEINPNLASDRDSYSIVMKDDIPLVIKDSITPELLERTKATRRKFRGVINNTFELMRNMIIVSPSPTFEKLSYSPPVNPDITAIIIPEKLQKLGVQIRSGAELATENYRHDNFPIDSSFIVFPASYYNYFLMSYSIGFIELENGGNEPICLAAWKRHHSNVGIPTLYYLKPNEISLFDYKGQWCIQIVQGNIEDLKVVDFNTWGGTGNYNNLKMLP